MLLALFLFVGTHGDTLAWENYVNAHQVDHFGSDCELCPGETDLGKTGPGERRWACWSDGGPYHYPGGHYSRAAIEELCEPPQPKIQTRSPYLVTPKR